VSRPGEPPAPPGEPGWAALPEPLGPADTEIGCPVAVRLVLARSEQAAVVLNGITAYREGIELELAIRLRAYPPGGRHWAQAIHEGSAAGPDAFRFAIELADGRAAILGRLVGHAHREHAVLVPRGASAQGRRFDGRYWLAPLPPPGRIVVVCAWPAAGIEDSRVAIDAAPILDAASRSELLWPGEPAPPGPPGWTASSTVVRREESGKR
jgi:hypothetical protein